MYLVDGEPGAPGEGVGVLQGLEQHLGLTLHRKKSSEKVD
jgi:hypothetical protein